MYRVEIGEPLDPSVSQWPEGIQYQFDDGGHWLMMYLSKPTRIEIDAVQRQPAEFALFLRKGVVFLLFRFGPMPWSDAAYTWWLVSPDSRKLPEVDDPPLHHALLKIFLVDSDTGIVKSIRALTFSVEFTAKLHQAILDQTLQDIWSPMMHDRVIMDVRREYPDSSDMLEDCIVTCKGGD